jgi:hypothetical protein
VHKKVSYPKQRRPLILHIFVLPGLLTRVLTRPGNPFSDFLPGRLPGFLPEIVLIPYSSRYSEPHPKRYPSHTRSFSRVLPGHVLDQVNLALPERLPDDEDITSMDTTSPIRWSWSSTYFWTAGKHLLATVVMASYGFQFRSSTTPWKDQVYFETDPASCGYLIRVGHNH